MSFAPEGMEMVATCAVTQLLCLGHVLVRSTSFQIVGVVVEFVSSFSISLYIWLFSRAECILFVLLTVPINFRSNTRVGWILVLAFW